MSLPGGTVTFMFTDIEGSTKLMQRLGAAYEQAHEVHHAILRAAFQNRQGRELRTEGDSFYCVFESALDACAAAAEAQRALAAQEWPQGEPIRVRMGLHTGEAPVVGNEYVGLDVHHAARVAGAAHGGQVLLSESTRALVESSLPPDLRVRDLGVHRLKDLARSEHLFQLLIEGLQEDFPVLKTLDTAPNNLPTQLTSFVGREADVSEAKDRLEGARLLTLTGPGGIGKTRLSLQLAAESIQRFPDGVYFVPLSAITDPALIESAIAQALRITVAGSDPPGDALREHLAGKSLLLVLDNFEQLLPEGAPVVSDLLHDLADLKLVVSSRAGLRIYGEQELEVQPLRTPDLKALPAVEALSQYEAVRLFIERAVAAKHDFQVNNDNAPAVAGICERVDGLPLAIELAAARVKLFSPQALLGRLESRLTVLAGGARDLPGRQQTLRGAIAWSYDLLDEPQKRLFARFSVFGRGANLEQAEAVCGPAEELGTDVLSGLDELAEQSLLRRLPDFDEPRLLMLQVIREFAAETLEASGEAETIRMRHASAYLALAQETAPRLFGAEQRRWLDRLEMDHDNFRGAFDWALAQDDPRCGLLLGSAMWRFWQMRSHLREGRTRLEAILARPGVAAHPAERLKALEAAGGIVYWLGDLKAAAAYYDQCLVLARESGDKKEIAQALYNCSFPPMLQQDTESGLALVEQALPIFRELADQSGVAKCLWSIANVFHQAGQEDRAVPPLEEAIGIFRNLGDRFSLAWALHTRATIALKAGQAGAAESISREGLTAFYDAGDISGVVLLLDDLAASAKIAGDQVRAFRLAGAAEAQQARTGVRLAALVNVNEGRAWADSIETDEERAAWSAGMAMTVDEAVTYALKPVGAVEAGA